MPAFAARDLDVGEDTPIEGHHVPEAGIINLEAAYERAVCALQDADDAALGAIAALMFEPRDDTVAVERLLDVGRRDVRSRPPLSSSGTTKP